MANRIHDFRINACPEHLFKEVHEYLDRQVNYCYLRADTVRREFAEKYGHLMETGDIDVDFADDFFGLDDLDD
jgi:hypothetical protein